MPVAEHRRPQLYELRTTNNCPFVPMYETENTDFYPFGHVKVPKRAIFLESVFSFATVNRKCIVTGRK